MRLFIFFLSGEKPRGVILELPRSYYIAYSETTTKGVIMSESNENHIIEVDEEFVPYEPSKLEKIKTAATIGAFYTFAGGVTAGSFYLSWKLTKMNLEAAKMNLEAARLAAQK